MIRKRHQLLEKQADEILLNDGRVYFQGYVKTSRPITTNGKRFDREQKRKKNRAAYDRLMVAYRALSKEAQTDLRDRYRAYNPNHIAAKKSWSEWLTVELKAQLHGLSLQ